MILDAQMLTGCPARKPRASGDDPESEIAIELSWE